jgi:hypothetical protein
LRKPIKQIIPLASLIKVKERKHKIDKIKNEKGDMYHSCKLESYDSTIENLEEMD